MLHGEDITRLYEFPLIPLPIIEAMKRMARLTGALALKGFH